MPMLCLRRSSALGFTAVIVIGMAVGALVRSALPYGKASPAAADSMNAPIERLIKQLGSKRFREREAASKALVNMDKMAVAALRAAAERHPDPEVRRRAAAVISEINARQTRHVAEQVRAIAQSKLGPAEKGRKLQPFLQRGMSSTRVRQLLGPPDLSVGGSATQHDVYRLLGLRITYRARSVSDWFVVGAKIIAAHGP